MNEFSDTYEPPFVMEMGDFSEETQGFNPCVIEGILVALAGC